MEYTLALDPALGLSAQALADDWNGDEACRALAGARLVRSAYGPDAAVPVLDLVGYVAGGLALNVAGNLVYEQLKPHLYRILGLRLSPAQVEIRLVREADGNHVVVINRAGQ